MGVQVGGLYVGGCLKVTGNFCRQTGAMCRGAGRDEDNRDRPGPVPLATGGASGTVGFGGGPDRG